MTAWRYPLIDGLVRIFGDGGVSSDDKTLDKYSRDLTGDDRYQQRPRAVVFPTSAAEVARLMTWANETETPVTPRGAGSGLAGAAVPAEGGVVCSFERMNRVLEIDPDNGIVVVEPGVVTNTLDKELAPHGLFFAGYPMSEDICFIGGNVAENAGGGRAVKYGVTGNYVLGAEVVTPTGSILHLGGKRLKDVTGYNLLPLFVGSEGTLGIFTELTLRVVPRPKGRGVLLAGFTDASKAVAVISRLKKGLSNGPSSIEFMDGLTARETNHALPSAQRTILPDDSGAFILVEVEAESMKDGGKELEKAESLVSNGQGSVIATGTDILSMERAWKLRKQVPWYVKSRAGSYHSLEDVVVPPSAVPEIVSIVEELRKRYGLPIALFGHAGDGNFHVTPMKTATMSPEEWYTTLDVFLKDLYGSVRKLGGTISGEHGIGRKRTSYLSDFLDAGSLELMRDLKDLLDPKGILNPGVVFPAQKRT